MLIEIWERLRGYHRWTETQATVESAKVEKTPFGGSDGSPVHYTTTAADTLAWFDQSGQKHSAAFTVPEDSPLFKLSGGDAVTIRYNPVDPGKFYLRDLLRARVQTVSLSILAGLFVVLFIAALILKELGRNVVRHHSKPLW